MKFLIISLLILCCSAFSFSQSPTDNWVNTLNGMWEEVLIEEYMNGEISSTWGGSTDLYVSDSVTTFISYPCGGFNWKSETTWTRDSLFLEMTEFQSSFHYGIAISNDTLILSTPNPTNSCELQKSYFVKAKYDAEIMSNLITIGYNPICYNSTTWLLMSYMDSTGTQVFITDQVISEMPEMFKIRTDLERGYHISNGTIAFNNLDLFLIDGVLWWGLYPDQLQGMLHLKKIDDTDTVRTYQYVLK